MHNQSNQWVLGAKPQDDCDCSYQLPELSPIHVTRLKAKKTETKVHHGIKYVSVDVYWFKTVIEKDLQACTKKKKLFNPMTTVQFLFCLVTLGDYY